MYLKVKDVAKELGICTKTAYDLIAAGKIESSRPTPNCIRVSPENLKTYMDNAKSVGQANQ